MKVVWRKVNIPEFEHYKVSNHGELLNTKTGNANKGHKTARNNGALQFTLTNKKSTKHIMAHLLVMSHFKKVEIGKEFAIHLNRIKSDNKIDNLDPSTLGNMMGDNKRHIRIQKGQLRGVYTFPIGKKNWRAMLSVGSGKTKTIGYFHTKEEAIVAYQEAFKNMYGEQPFKEVY